MTTKEEEIERAIRLTFDSLESHLKWTYEDKMPKGETRDFHKKCVQEYAEVIRILSKLY